MRPIMVSVDSRAPRAAGMSTIRCLSSISPGRGCPEGSGEKVTSLMAGLSGERGERMLARIPARREEGVDRGAVDVLEALRIPARLVVLVDDAGADALAHVALVEARVHQAQLHAEAIGEAHLPAAAQLLERDLEERGRALREPGEGRIAPGAEFGALLGGERQRDRLDGAVREVPIDGGPQALDLAGRIRADVQVGKAAVDRVRRGDG